MKVEYDEALCCFRIYASEYDINCVVAFHHGVVQSYRVLDDHTLEVIGQFGERHIFNRDGQLVI